MIGIGGVWELLISLDHFPNVILGNMIGVIGTAADLIECPTFGYLDLMGVQIVFGLDVAEDEGVIEGVWLSGGVDLVQ